MNMNARHAAAALLRERGVKGAAELLADVCMDDARTLENGGKSEAARLMRAASATYRTTARRLTLATRDAWDLILSGKEDLAVALAGTRAYEDAVENHPKGGGLLGATARGLVAEHARDEAIARPRSRPARSRKAKSRNEGKDR